MVLARTRSPRQRPHPLGADSGEDAWYADICVPGNTTYLVMGEQSLAEIAGGTRKHLPRPRPHS
jgi:hypothetical protein